MERTNRTKAVTETDILTAKIPTHIKCRGVVEKNEDNE